MKKIFFIVLLIFPISLHAQYNYKMIIQGSPDEPLLNPITSPDGKKIAYSHSSYVGLYVFDLQTSTTVKISDEAGAGFGFQWSSDSKSILARVAKYENQKRYNAVKIFNSESLLSNQLTDYLTLMPYLPLWADGDSKIYLRKMDNDEMLSSGIDKNNFINNEILVFEKNNKIVVKNLSNNSEQAFEPIKESQYINVSTSPDGAKIIFEVVGGNMFTMNIDGSNLTDLGKGYRPKWSSDSKKIVYMISEDDGHKIISSDLYIINTDGTEKINLTNTSDIIEMNPCFAPDSKSIVFDVVNDGSIYLMSLE